MGFGALNVDKLYSVNHIAQADEESYIKESQISCGGSAANTIIGLSKLGMRCGFIGQVAADPEGDLLLENLKKFNVDVKGVNIVEKGESGTVLGFVDEEGHRALYVDPGVNDGINLKELPEDYSNSKLIHLTSFVGSSFQAQVSLMDIISDKVMVSLDPGHIYAQRGSRYLEGLLSRTNILLTNEAELKLLTDKKYKTFQEESQHLLEIGIQILVVKRGDKGSYVTNGEESYHIDPFPVTCVDSTGAGDAYNAGFLYGLLNGENILKCGKLGSYLAACCIRYMGSINGLPEKSQLESLEMENF